MADDKKVEVKELKKEKVVEKPKVEAIKGIREGKKAKFGGVERV